MELALLLKEVQNPKKRKAEDNSQEVIELFQ